MVEGAGDLNGRHEEVVDALSERREIPRSAKIALEVGFALALFVLVVVIHGLVPGTFFPVLGASLAVVALGESLALGSLWSCPQHFGYPLGAPVATGAPVVYVEAVLIKIFGLSGVNAFIVANWIFLAAAFLGARALLRSFGIGEWLASLSSAIYLTSIFILGHQGITVLMLAFALLPCSILLDLSIHNALASAQCQSATKVGLLVACSFAWRIGLLLLDGYTFVISAVFPFCLLVFAIATRPRMGWKRWLGYASLIVAAYGVAYAVYGWYIPGGSGYAAMPADFFRAQGADLATLVVSLNNSSQLWSWIGISPQYTAYQFYGDGSNAFYNYLGLSLLIGIAGAVFLWRREPVVRPLVAAGAICLLLAIGPSIKVMDIRPPVPATGKITFSDYLMPPQQATLNLGTDRLYTQPPGIRVMRAVYRWLSGFKAVIFLLSTTALAFLLRSRRFVLAGVCLCLLVVDSVPPIKPSFARYAAFEKAKQRFYGELIPEMRSVIGPRSTVLFVSSENDYLANPIATALDVRTYNVGGDKNVDMAKLHWPPEVQAIRAGKDVIKNARRLHERGDLDFLVFPHFNLRWDSYRWPPNPKQVAELKGAAQTILSQTDRSGLAVTEAEYVTIVAFLKPMPPT